MGITGGAAKLRLGNTAITTPSPRFQRRPLPIVSKFIAVLFLISIFIFSGSALFKTLDASAAAPTVTSISPDNGPIAGGTVITITGSGFKGQYERVEALIFDGNSYIDTGVNPYNSYINARFEMDLSDTSTINMVFGTSGTSAQQTGFAKAAGASGSYTAYRNGTSSTGGNGFVKANERNDVTIDASTNYHVNGSTIPLAGTSVTGTTLWVGAAANPASFYRGKIFAFRIYNSSVVITHNFMPVKRLTDGQYGLVDMQSGIFYGNSGTGTISGGTTVNDIFTVGATIPGGLSPDRQIEVLIDGRACTGLTIVSNTELRCNTPSGVSLGQKDVVVRDSLNLSDSTAVANGYEYALRLNSVLPKFGDPGETTEIEIEGGVFSTPPEQYDSVDGLVFDGRSWIETGFDQLGDTKTVITLKYGTTETGLPTTGHMGLYGTRNANSGDSNVIWAGVNMSTMRSDYGTATTPNSNATLSNLGLTTTPRQVQVVTKDNGNTTVTPGNTQTAVNTHGLTPLPLTGTGIKMLLGSLTHGSSYGTNSNVAYSSFVGTIYSTQICKALNAIPAGTIYQHDESLCGSNRVLVRDFRPAVRATDEAYGFYDMVTGAFFENAGFGTFKPETITTENDLEVPLELRVNFTYTDENDIEQTGICANPKQVTVNEATGELSPTKIKCTMPTSPLPGDGQGKVDLTVYANDVEATSGTADANDFYYGSPMVVETISPNRGPTAGWQTVTITGNNFHPSLNSVPNFDPETDWGSIEISIGGSICNFELDANDSTKLANVSHYTNTSITCTTTPNPGGISDIEATLTYFDEIEQEVKTNYYLYGGALDPISGAITSGYLYEGDLISVSPNIGPTTGGTVVTITGNGFVTSPNITTQIFFGNVAVNPTTITVVSYTEIRVTAPRSAITGLVNVTIVQTGETGYAASFTSNPEDGFEYEFVTGTGTLSPNQAYTTGGDTILITGQFDREASAIVTLSSGVAPNQVITTLDPQSISILSDTQIEIITPAHNAGVVLVTVNQFDTDIPIANLTYVSPLAISSIAPDSGPMSGGSLVTIAGNSFIPIGYTATTALANLSITIGGSPCSVSSVANYTNTSITCATSAHSPSVVDVTVSVGIGVNHNFTLQSSYTYLETELSISTDSVNITSDIPGIISASNTIVSVRTGNPSGYSILIDSDSTDLTCTESGSTAKYTSILSSGTLTETTWGWAEGSVAPTTTWRPIPTSNTPIVAAPTHPTGPNQDGTAFDDYTIWFGTNTSLSQPPCAYQSTLTFTAIPMP